MNNLNNISEYQKIVFVNGIDEANIEAIYNNGMTELSETYPFVVFISKDNVPNQVINNQQIEISNIWFDGKRLTRFIGINKNSNTININGHEIKLNFEYETGLLSLYDVNTLSEISITQIEYTDLDGNSQIVQYNSQNGISNINAKDNKFKIHFNFVINEDNISGSQDITIVSKNLNFESNIFEEFNKETGEPNSEKTKQEHIITYKINNPKYETDLTQFISEYSNNVNCELKCAKYYLNPISYTISTNYQNQNRTINNSINVSEGDNLNIILNFNPSNISNNNNHKLKAHISFGNNNDNLIIINANEEDQTIINGKCTFPLTIANNVAANHTATVNVGFKITYQLTDDTEETEYSDLQKNIIINIEGEQSNQIFYFGYETPTANNLDSLLAENDYTEKTIGTDILWNNEVDRNNNQSNYYDDKYFYCVIPTDYVDIIKPRWAAYTINESDEQTYVPCLEWFDEQESTITAQNGLIYKIYKRQVQGKFYGYVQ